MSVRVVGLCSSYKEGRLAFEAVRSLREAELDDILVYEGPAGPPLHDDIPDTDLDACYSDVRLREGRWRTDARKRTQMIKDACARYPGPLWAVWVDGDEILVNGRFLRDWLQALEWRDEEEQARDAGAAPTAGMPINLVELDGSVTVCRAKVLRIDLISSYLVSSSGILYRNGVTQAEGNLPLNGLEWFTARKMHVEAHTMLCTPPLPCEPHLLHRSGLRHPGRKQLRMHEQEADELRRLGVL